MNTIPIKHIRRGAKRKRNMAKTSQVPGERRETSAAKTDNQQFKESRSDNQDPPSKSSNKGRKESSFSPKLNEQHSHICGESAGSSEHIATFGLGDLKIIQYFTCKTFKEKTPAARLKILRDKGFCSSAFFQEPTLHKENTMKEDVSVILSVLIQAIANTPSKIMY